MVPTFAFEPHKGFGPAILGSPREDARAAMALAGFPMKHSRKRSDYFCDSAIQIESDESGVVQFVGVAYSARFNATYRGVGVFSIGAEQLFHLIAAADSTGAHVFDASEYRFPGQIMTLWQADTQYDYLGSESRLVWAQVGLGNERYLASIRKILRRS